MISGNLIVLRQLLGLLLTATGYGGWLWILTGRPSLRRNRDGIWLGLAGFCVHELLLQSFVYLGLPLQVTARPAFVLGLIGLALALGRWKQKGGGRCKFSGEAKLYALVFAGAFLGQAPALLVLGPERYFGRAQFDQANYVAIAEFLRTEPFSTREDDIGYRPWLVRALEAKGERLTECVVLGAAADVDGSDPQAAYGTVSLFFIALAGVATAAWLRESGLPRWAAGWAGLGTALTPALTRIHFDGFFSQNMTLFVYPALAGLLVKRGELNGTRKLCAAVFLAFFIGSYSEVAGFGIMVTVGLVLAAGRPWRRKIFDLAFILAGALLLNTGYFGYLVNFLMAQARTTLANPETLAALFPESGTLTGWGRLFVDLPWKNLVTGGGVLVAGLGICGATLQPARRRTGWWVTLGVLVLPLLALRVMPHFSSYAFAKLTMHFTPVWIGAAMAGVVSLNGVSRRKRSIGWIVGGFGATAGFALILPSHWAVIHPASGRQRVLASEEFLQVRRALTSHPQPARLVTEGDPLVALWLCYFGRASNVVLDRLMIGDRVVPSETYAFRRWTKPLGELHWLDTRKQGPVENYEPPPALVIQGALETGKPDLWRYYVAGDTIDFVFRRPTDRPETRLIWLDLVIVPLPPNEPCELVLKDSKNQVLRMILRTPGWHRFPLSLPAGESRCRLEVIPAHAPVARGPRAILQCLSLEITPDPLPSS